MKKTIVNTLGIALLSFASLGIAAEPYEAEIKARQAFMQVLKFNLGIVGDMAKGKRDYDAKLAESVAKNVHAASLMDNGAMWPKGSDNTNADLTIKTAALPKIWSNFPEVVEKHKAWIEASTALAANAGKGLDALREYVVPVAKSCQSCHKSFRAK